MTDHLRPVDRRRAGLADIRQHGSRVAAHQHVIPNAGSSIAGGGGRHTLPSRLAPGCCAERAHCDVAPQMAAALKGAQHLEFLDLGANGLHAGGAAALAAALRDHPKLKHLEVGMNPLGEEGAKTIADVVKFNLPVRRASWRCSVRSLHVPAGQGWHGQILPTLLPTFGLDCTGASCGSLMLGRAAAGALD